MRTVLLTRLSLRLSERNMPLSDEKKVDVLLASLEERYRSIHIIRERVQSVCLWVLGLSMFATGWIIQSNLHFQIVESILYILALAVVWYVFIFFYFANLEKGFRAQLRTAANIESSLHLYDAGFYITDKTIYPLVWKNAGGENFEGKFFLNHYIIFSLGLIVLAAIILFNICI